jgi:hypothetical protein
MKIQEFAVLGGVLLASEAGAQVMNDVCADATIFYMPTGGCTVWDGSPGLFWFGDSINTAIANFPYPANPNPCAGYTSTIAAPANDRWYMLPNNGPVQVRLSLECSDTCHVSWWRGACGTLQPMQCYTLAPNVEQAMEPFATSTATDTFYMQISGNGGLGNFAYHACVKLNPAAGNPTPVTDPTPVICFTHDIAVVPASSEVDMDGSISVTMTQGTPPYSILWTDGDTTFDRTGLSVGDYVYTITDVDGCSETDTVGVGSQVSTGASVLDGIDPLMVSLGPQPGTITINLNGSPIAGRVFVHDVMGRSLLEQQLPATGIIVVPSSIHPGVVIVSISTNDRTQCQKIFLPTFLK